MVQARLWRRRDEGGANFWTTGVTYRGYLGADRDACAMWLTEDSAREAQALLRMAAAAGRLGAWSVELATHKWVWSDEVKAIHDMPPDFEPTTEQALAFYTRESQEAVLEAFEACVRDGAPFDLELQLVTAHGRDVWIRAIGEAERDVQGRITHVRGAMQDVSRFRAAADESRRTAERFTHMLESLPDGFLLLDRQWRFIYLNAAAETILRRQRGELLGRSLPAEFPETSGKFLERCRTAISQGCSVEFEKFHAALGIWVHMKLSPCDQGLMVCIRDDTERMNARREVLALRARLESLGARS